MVAVTSRPRAVNCRTGWIRSANFVWASARLYVLTGSATNVAVIDKAPVAAQIRTR
jgi:hypothetical protein